MDIVCSLDNNYVMPTGIMICSLCENNQDEDVVFHILSADISEENKGHLKNLVFRYHHQIVFYYINDDNFADFPINRPGQSSHIHSIATYYRLFLGIILPTNIHKVIYLDGDIIVRHSLRSLWNKNLNNYAIAAVPDMDNNNDEPYDRLHYQSSMGYFNAGVLLINLRYWREHNVLDDFYEFVRIHPDRLRCHDQDILNYVFRQRKLVLDVTYNFQQPFLYRTRYLNLSSDIIGKIDNAIHDPVIIHYIMAEKPWFKDCRHPYKYEFEKYKKLTIWKDAPERYYYSMRGRLKNKIKTVFCLLGLLDRPMYRDDL